VSTAFRQHLDDGTFVAPKVSVWQLVFGIKSFGSVHLLTSYLFLLMFIPSSLILGALGADGTPAMLLSFIMILWYVAWWITGRITPAQNSIPVQTAMFVFLMASVASFVAAMTRDITQVESLGADRALLSTLAWFGIIVVISHTVTTYSQLDALMRRLVVMGSVVAAIGIFEFYTGIDVTKYIQIPGLTVNLDTALATRSGFNRPPSTAIDPIELGVVMAMLLPFALQQALNGEQERSRLRRWCPVALIAFAIPLTVSRSGIVGAAVCLLFVTPTWTGRQLRGFLVAGLLSLGALKFAAPGLITTLGNYFSAVFTGTGDGNSVSARVSALSVDQIYISQRPIFGRGTGTFIPQIYSWTDNMYLHILIEMGVVGTVSLILIFLAGMHCGAAGRRRTQDAQRRAFGQALVASVAVAAVASATFDSLSFPMFAGVLFTILGSAGAYYQIMTMEFQSPTPLYSLAKKEVT